MIQPIKLNTNLNFRGAENFKDFKIPKMPLEKIATEPMPAPSAAINTTEAPKTKKPKKVKPQKEKTTFKQKLHNAKKGVLNFVKGINNINYTAGGVLKGIKDGAIAMGIVGLAGKNIQKSEGSIGARIAGTVGGIIQDTGKAISNVGSFIPKAFHEPVKSLKSAATLPPKFFTQYLKGHKAVGAIAAGVGTGFVVINTIVGKMRANKANAEVDHYTNEGHVA